MTILTSTRLLAIRGAAQEALDYIHTAQGFLDNHVKSSGDKPGGRGSDIALTNASSKLLVIISRCNDGLRALAEGKDMHWKDI